MFYVPFKAGSPLKALVSWLSPFNGCFFFSLASRLLEVFSPAAPRLLGCLPGYSRGFDPENPLRHLAEWWDEEGVCGAFLPSYTLLLYDMFSFLLLLDLSHISHALTPFTPYPKNHRKSMKISHHRAWSKGSKDPASFLRDRVLFSRTSGGDVPIERLALSPDRWGVRRGGGYPAGGAEGWGKASTPSLIQPLGLFKSRLVLPSLATTQRKDSFVWLGVVTIETNSF